MENTAGVPYSVGMDLVDIGRMERSFERFGPRFRDRIYTEEEIAYCEGYADSIRGYAARFSAKEAVMKVLGTGFGNGVRWKDISVSNGPSGRPSVTLTGRAGEVAREKGIKEILISLTHTDTTAGAVAVGVGGKGGEAVRRAAEAAS